MKYVSNALIALIAAFLINYLVIRVISARRRASHNKMLDAMIIQFRETNPQARFKNRTRVYSPPSSSSGGSSGGGGGFSGGGGGGGGGHSGGGGGHSF